jgi:hypothetical protein
MSYFGKEAKRHRVENYSNLKNEGGPAFRKDSAIFKCCWYTYP